MRNYRYFTFICLFCFSFLAIAQEGRGKGENSEDVYIVVEMPPQFPGGEEKMMQYIAKKIEYPREARENGIQGRVVIQFVIDEKGRVTDAKVIKGIGYGCDEEALRVVNKMPKWTPGAQRGKIVKVRYVLPINFVLSE